MSQSNTNQQNTPSSKDPQTQQCQPQRETPVGDFTTIEPSESLQTSIQNIGESNFQDMDKTAPSRKQDHIALAFQSQVQKASLDNRFYYEPILSAHPKESTTDTFRFLGKNMQSPIWISSMTGGTAWAGTINRNLARVAKDFGFGMGLGSCRSLLTDDTHLKDFDVRTFIGDNLPLFANLGIAQLERLIQSNQLHLIDTLLDKLCADGLIIHVNPMQEWLQPEGDQLSFPPIETITRLLDQRPSMQVIVKEVGQGMGISSLRALLELPLAAIDFAAAGGTSFALLELLRSDEAYMDAYKPFTTIGHSASEMVDFVNSILHENSSKVLCQQFILSGGISSFLDGYYLIQKINRPAIYGQASSFLKYARGSYEELFQYAKLQVDGLKMAGAFLRIK